MTLREMREIIKREREWRDDGDKVKRARYDERTGRTVKYRGSGFYCGGAR